MSDLGIDEKDLSFTDDEDFIAETKGSSKPSNSSPSLSRLNRFQAGSKSVTSTPSRPPPKSKPSSVPAKPLNPFNKSGKSFQKENEERYSWLVNKKDADGNPEDHPDYDPRTLQIPSSAWAKFTAFEKQYWEVKSKMWNTVVFFKKGKFYELYENDAEIAHGVFDLKLAGGGRANMKLAGVPEMSFDYWAAAFIAKGYKVARVDQVETALAKEMRESGGGKKEDKVIRRELTCVLTGGTLVDDGMMVDELATYCMAIKQVGSNFGVAWTDTATGQFMVTQFKDDVDYSQFETLVAQVRPGEFILEKGVISQRAVKILKNNTNLNVLWNYLKPREEFWDAITTLEEVVRGDYFEAENLDDYSHFPEKLREMCEDVDNNSFALSAFGGLCSYLRMLKIDKSVVSMGNINGYDAMQRNQHMVLDGQSLQNLEIFRNTSGGTSHTVFNVIDRTITPFGKRQLQIWLCHPLFQARQINARLDAVEMLMEDDELREYMEKKMALLPDLERLLSRIHAGRLPPKDFLKVIQGYNVLLELLEGLKKRVDPNNAKHELLRDILSKTPDLNEILPQWNDAFSWSEAKENNLLIPEPGVEHDFDESTAVIKGIESDLLTKLREYRKEYRSQDICYKDSGKEIYLLEFPAKFKAPKEWQIMGATSKVKRYWSPEVKVLVRSLMEARERHKLVADQVQANLYAKFNLNYKDWLAAVKSVAYCDCLLSLARTSLSFSEPHCRPNIVTDSYQKLEFEELRHPTFAQSMDFIPNDVVLGGKDHANFNLLTGANAAGKSTVLRMTCVAVILAQMGCHVPAASATLTPFDRIMTRLGAMDNIFLGQSTFFVELSEAKRMLSEATPCSLVVLDELGRGGSSSDGFGIAEAVLHHLATYVGCLGFFATHYGTLYNSFEKHIDVSAKQMAILVNDDKERESERKITFLYKLVDGISPGSFGMHVATMCGIAKEIVDAAEDAAVTYEHTSRMKRILEDSNKSRDTILPVGVQSDYEWLVRDSRKTLDLRKATDDEERTCERDIGRDTLCLSAYVEEELRLKHALKSILEGF